MPRIVTTTHGGCVVCGEGTAEAKPWCARHVLTHSPYASAVHEEILRQERSKGRGTYTEEMLTDARALLENTGGLTVKRMAKLMGVSVESARRIARRLVVDGEARAGRTRRGRETLEAA